MKYAIKIEYIGKNYSGSQIQGRQGKKAPATIQSEIEIALYTLLKTKIKTIFSGRTDAGVNAKGQIVHFETDKKIVASQFINSLNGLLPKDISVSELKEVSEDFHAQKSAKKRYYQYVFYNRKQRSAFDGDLMLVKYDLSIEKMQNALRYLIGEHDFSSFRSSRSSVPNKVCFIYKAECQKLGDTITVNIEGNRFLYNMVRIIVGTLLLIEKNNLPPEIMKEILDGKDRRKAGKTFSPYGLTLIKVDY
jgi:tRNA pseudouridine38-40 synthase